MPRISYREYARPGPAGGINAPAFVLSAASHALILWLLAVIRLPAPPPAQEPRPVPQAKMAAWSRLVQAGMIVPTPKVKPLPVAGGEPGYETASVESIFNRSAIQAPLRPAPADAPASDDVSSGTMAGAPLEFTAVEGAERKVCYLVDCSGSMKGLFSGVKKSLGSSIASLEADQYFNVILFGNGRIDEFAQTRLVRATPEAKTRALAFIERARPSGSTNAIEALRRSLELRDELGLPPAVVYLLTDGFELAGSDMREFDRKAAALLTRIAPSTKINTVGFRPLPEDMRMLETIAARTGGSPFVVAQEKAEGE